MNKTSWHPFPCVLLALVGLLIKPSMAQQPVPADTAPGGYQPEVIGEPEDGRMKEKPRIEDLGGERYRIGAILVDKANHRFTVPGVMLPYGEGKAIEFLATTNQGFKSYESVFSLNSNAFEFNLACILIGLEAKRAVAPRFHFDPQPAKGDSVSVRVSWEQQGNTHEHDAVELLKSGEKSPDTPSTWSYIGSAFIQGDRYLAQMDGVLIGLVHDPASIIEHREGIGLGNWGMLVVNGSKAPATGTPITLTVNRLGEGLNPAMP